MVVEGSPNSLDETLLRTKRQCIIDIKPMSREMIWQIEQLQDLFKYVKEADFCLLCFLAFLLDTKNSGAMQRLTCKMANPRNKSLVLICVLKSLLLVKDSKSKMNDMDEIIKLFDKEKKLILSDSKCQEASTSHS